MNPSDAAWWLSIFAEYLIKTSLILSLCLLMVSAARNRSAALRHSLLSFFLIGLLLLPAVSAGKLGWETPLLPLRGPVARNQLEKAREDAAGIRKSAIRRIVSIPLSGRSETGLKAGAKAPSAYENTVSIRLPGSLLPFIWCAGLAFLAVKFGVGIVGACRLTRAATDVRDPSWRALLSRFLLSIGIRREVRLKSHSTIGIPITWGLLNPVILIPGSHGEWTEDQRSTALVHELCHIKRADLLVMFLVRLSSAVFWFNPLCWIVCRRLKLEQERACDELVLSAGIKPSTYAASLLYFRQMAASNQNVPAAFLGLFGSASFPERLSAILKQKLTLEDVTMKTKIILAIAVILAVSLIGMARPSSAVPENPVPWNLEVSIAAQPVMPASAIAAAAPDGIDQDKKVDVVIKKEKAEAEKQKQDPKQAVIVKTKEGEKKAIRVFVAGDASEKIVIEKPIVIQKNKDGNLVVLDPDGKELAILEGKPLRLAVEGKELTVIQEGDLLKLDRGGAANVILKKVPKGAVAMRVAPRVKVLKVGEGDAKEIEVLISKKGEDAWVVLEKKDLEQTAEQKEKLRELREKLAQSKGNQAEIAEIKKAIKDLVKVEVQEGMIVKRSEKPMTFTLVQPKRITAGDGKSLVLIDPVKKYTAVMTRNGEALSIRFDIDPGAGSREVYDRVVAGVKQELAAGFTVEPDFNETSGAVTLKITATGAQKVQKDLIRKVVDVIKTEIKQKK